MFEENYTLFTALTSATNYKVSSHTRQVDLDGYRLPYRRSLDHMDEELCNLVPGVYFDLEKDKMMGGSSGIAVARLKTMKMNVQAKKDSPKAELGMVMSHLAEASKIQSPAKLLHGLEFSDANSGGALSTMFKARRL